ncbi:hypothetical protein FNB15_18235 [Ferrovibrio terrae]|uniref:Uncharacterized protein n=1 Tax=Ferrovibrio terrae TaxID=2594003 RepID=A0A516H5P7_9PROT|nr:hypothetical protein [Ferrovibrio terrae]QDO99088.1 hypothetical protein FNB15_18235 [Ferrovibrio terrae]
MPEKYLTADQVDRMLRALMDKTLEALKSHRVRADELEARITALEGAGINEGITADWIESETRAALEKGGGRP